MRGYGQFCPISQALEVLGERWTLLVVRELLCGSTRFSDLLKGVPLMPRSVLAARLVALADAGIVQRKEDRAGSPTYHLTAAGEALLPVVIGLGNWGKRWVKGGVTEEQLDPTLLLWDVHRRIDHSHVPPQRIVVAFDFPDAVAAKRRIWLTLEKGAADVCFTNPGYEADVVVTARVRVLTEVWLGTRRWPDCVRTGEIDMEGPADLKRLFPACLQLSLFAEPAAARRAGEATINGLDLRCSADRVQT